MHESPGEQGPAAGVRQRLKNGLGRVLLRLMRRDDVRRALCDLAPELFARLRYKMAWGRWPDLDHPRDFDEKLMWLILRDRGRNPLRTRCTDKLAMRSWAAGQGLGPLLPRLYGVYSRAREIDFAALPERVALKCTHGCGFNLFRRTRAELDERAARRQLDAWLGIDYETRLGEVQYRGIPRRIIAEELFEEAPGQPPNDYKLYSFNGRVAFAIVCSGRRPGGGADYDSYDRHWQPTPLCSTGRSFPRPPAYDRMLEAAEVVGRNFPFVRVDFYSIGGRPVLGEITFTPAGCITDWCDAPSRMALGQAVRL